MKKIIFLLLILISGTAYSQSCPTMHSRVDSLVACKFRLKGFSTGILKIGANGIGSIATPGTDYATPGSLSDSLDNYLKLSGGIMTGAISAGGQPSVDPAGRFLYYSTGATSMDFGEGALFSLDGLSSLAFYDGSLGVGLNYGGSSTGYIKTSNLSGGNKTYQLPNISGDVLTHNSTATLTNKTWNGVVIGSSYGGAGTVNGILKANGSGIVSAAVAGTDYQTPLTNPVTGVGAAVRLALWKGTSSQTSDGDLTYDSTTNTLTNGGDISLTGGNRNITGSNAISLRAASMSLIDFRINSAAKYAIDPGTTNEGNHVYSQTNVASGTNTFVSYTQGNHTGGIKSGFLYTAGTLTGQTASTEITDFHINNSATLTRAAGTVALQRAVRFRGRTYAFASSSTITEAVNVDIDPCVAGSNATISENTALRVNGNTKVTGNLTLSTAGSGLLIKEGTNATMGTTTLVGGTVAVSTTKVTANSRIFLTVKTAGGTQGFLSYTVSAGTSFTINSTSGTETSTVDWIIIEPAP